MTRVRSLPMMLCAASLLLASALLATEVHAGRPFDATPAPFVCTCDNSSSPSSSSLRDPVSLPSDLTLHQWSSYETIWYIGQVSTVGETPARRFGVLYMLYGGETPDNCPSKPIAVWAALAVPDVTETTPDAATAKAKKARWLHATPSEPSPLSAGPVAGTFIQDSRILPTLVSSASPFELWDATNQWGFQQSAGSSVWQNFNMTASSLNGGGFAYDLQLDGSIVPVQAMAKTGVTPGTCTQHRGQPRIAARGTVTLGQEVFQVEGTVWYQHMWGSDGTEPFRWRWYDAELSDGWSGQFVFFDAPYHNTSYGNVISPDGLTNIFVDTTLIQLSQDPNSAWKSPRSGLSYNTSSTITVPSLQLELHFQTWIQDNEVMFAPTSPAFYEGVSDVWGTHLGLPVTGNGYTERYGETQAQAANQMLQQSTTDRNVEESR